MLPGSGCVCWLMRCMVKSPDRKGDDHGAAAARDVGPGRPRRAGTPLPDHPRRHHPDPLPDGSAARRGPPGRRGRPHHPPQPRHGAPGAQALPGPRSRRRAAPAPSGSATPLPARLGAGADPGGRSGPPPGRGRQRAVDLSALERLPGRGHRPSGGDRDRQAGAAPGGVCVQAAPLGPFAQGAGPAGVGKKRLRVEALLAAAASPLPPPAADLVPDATLADPDELVPEDLPRLLGLLAGADLYLQDEVEVALHPTLTRVWSRSGRAGQRRVQTPGNNAKQYGFGLVDWREGWLDFALADGRRAAPLVAQLRPAVARSCSRGRIAMVILDNLGIHTPKGSRLLRGLLAEVGEDLVLVYTPTYDPDANRIEWLWRALRRTVTHTHQRQRLDDLVADADRWARTITPAQVLSQIGSPFAPDQQPAPREVRNHAA